MADVPCRGKRIRQVRILSCDKLWRGQKALVPTDDGGINVILRDKHREAYMAHRDYHKRTKRECYELGIELIIDSMNIHERRGRVQRRLLSGLTTVVDPLGLRSSDVAAKRLDSNDQNDSPDTPDFSKVTEADNGNLTSSSSSDITMPELVESCEDASSTTVSNLPVPSVGDPHASFTQNVRNELELLAEKSIASDASQWAKQYN